METKSKVKVQYSDYSPIAVGPKDWFVKQVIGERKLYEKDLKKGIVDKGYLWSSLYLQIFIEGVFTLRYVPNSIAVEIPGGLFSLNAMEKDGKIQWLIRNDRFGTIGTVDPQVIGEWAVENYPDGIDNDGYLLIVHQLLCSGAETETQRQDIWDRMFYDDVA